MRTFKITANGQLTLTADLLAHLGVQPGGTLIVGKVSNGSIELRALPRGKISDAFGCLRDRGEGAPLSIDEINMISAEGWAGKR
jgi:hypothetical protein